MEQAIKIRTRDKHIIYGTLNYASKKTKKLIVFVHGLTGHENEHIFYNSARFFPKKGFATFRFNLYDGREKGRSLRKSTIKIHGRDLTRVVRYFQRKFKKIYVVGHSLGGPTILLSNLSFVTAIVFWDPSDLGGLKDIVEGQERKLKRITSLNSYVFDWGTEWLLGGRMAKEYTHLKPVKMVRNVHKPLKIIAAQKGNVIASRKYLKQANNPKKLVIIKKAGHCFDEEGVEEKLFLETLKWFKKHS